MKERKYKTLNIGKKKIHIHFLTIVGSSLHGLKTKESDLDIKGVFVWGKEELNGLEDVTETLSHKNTLKSDWSDLMKQINNEFNLNLEDNDDLDLFEAKKFMKTTLKNDFNMFDMIFSKLKPIFITDEFKKTLDKKEYFIDMKKANQRFNGMSNSCVINFKKLGRLSERTAKQDKDLLKNMAKSLQFLFSLKNLFESGTFNTNLYKEQQKEVLSIKNGNKSQKEVEKRHKELQEEVEDIYLSDKNRLDKFISNRIVINKLLVELNLNSVIPEKINNKRINKSKVVSPENIMQMD